MPGHSIVELPVYRKIGPSLPVPYLAG